MRNWIRRVFARDKADATIIRTDAASTPDSITDDQADQAANAPQAQVGAVPEILRHGGWAHGRGWEPGTTMLGLYQVKATIQGGMGVIHRVRHLGWDMDLAVKVPRPEFFRTQHQKNLFTAECERWVNLGLHPNVVSCYYVRIVEDIPAVFAEWIDGGSLSDWIDSRRLYEGDSSETLLRILDIAIQFAWGLNYAHNKSVVHQDVKPSNLMVDPEGIAKITDFGIARAAANVSPLMAAPSVGGIDLHVESGGSTLPYRSPEQAAWRESSARKTTSLSHKTDIWSWAVSVLEMFCGGLRWEDGLIAAEVLRETRRRGSHFSMARSIPPAVYGLLEQCLQVDPGVRPNSMIDVVKALVPVYEATAGQPYPRARIKRAAHGEAEPAISTAGDVSNRALSLLDLRKTADALRVLRSWLTEHPTDPVAWCNESLMRVADNQASLIEAVRQYVEFIGPSRPRWHDLGIEPSRYLAFVARHYTADHSSAVVGLHWLPSADALLSVSQDGLLLCRKLESNNWQILWRARTDRNDVTGSWLITNAHVAIGHADGTLELRDLADGALLARAKLEPAYKPPYAVLSGTSLPISNAVRGVVHDPATNRLRVYLQNADLLEVSFPTLEVLSDRHEQRDFTFCATAPRDASFVLLGELQGVLRFYRSAGEGPQRILENRHQVNTTDSRTGEKGTKVDRADLRCLSSSPDGTWVASGSREGGILLWRTADILSAPGDPPAQAAKEWIFHGAIETLAFGHDSKRLFFSDSSHVLRSIDLISFSEPSVLARCNSAVQVIAPSPDNCFLGVGCSNGTVLFQPLNGVTWADLPFLITRPRSPDEHLRKQEELTLIAMKARAAYAIGHYHECQRLAEKGLTLSADQEEFRRSLDGLLLRLPARRVRMRSFSHKWSFSDFKRGLVSAVGHRPYVNALAVATLRGFVVVATDEGVYRLRLEDGGYVGSINIPQTGVMDYEEKGDSCAVCTVVGVMGIVYFLQDSDPTFTKVGGSLTSVVRLGSQQELCACASDDGFVSFLGGSNNLRRLRVMHGSIETIALTPDSTCLAVAGADEVVGLLEIASGRGLARFEGHTDTIRCLQFDPEGGLLASAGDDMAVRIWQVAERAEYRVLNGHNARVQALAFSPDGDWLATGDAAGLIRIWDVFGEQHGQIESPHGEVSSLAFDKDGGALVSGHRQGTVDCWQLAWHLDLSETNLRRHADQAKLREAAQRRSPRPS